MVNMNEGDPKHTHEKAKGCVSTANTDKGRPMHTNWRRGDKRGVSTANV